ncbi:MAG: carboxyl-terminal processing protease, partial [Verrucomicrobiales bacterium]
ENHIEAPTRQQLVLVVARSLYKAGAFQPPGDLATQVSKLQAEVEYRPILQTILDKHSTEDDRSWACQFAASSLIDSLPGKCATIPAKDYAVQDQIAANRYVGVGIVLNTSGEGIPMIAKVFPSGPISKVGSRDGDEIWQIDGVDVRKSKLTEVIELLRGDIGTQVEMVLKPKNANARKVVVTRNVVPMKAVQKLQVLDGSRIGIVSIDQLRASVAHELRSMEAEVAEKGLQGLVIDFRNTQEGRAHDVKLLADALLLGGAIGTIDDGKSRPKVLEASLDAVFAGLELAVLVDSDTSGTVEWLAAILQRNQRAIVVGNLTPGSPYAMEGFQIKDEPFFLKVPSAILGLGENESLVHWRVLEDRNKSDRPMPWLGFAGQRWGIEPDIWIGGDFLNEAMRAGIGQSEVYIKQAKEELERRISRAAI